ncbi:MAG: ectonucleotide pyrophosphatase/phosphodiesterase [Youngiibacter sp.]|nr:ectonucleotide pyrophosphatase/phosphodiesterase [Youngiibacter sp.]
METRDRKRRFVIISFDALSSRDMDVLKNLPGFSRLYRDGSYCENVRSVYPSLTYPAHCSISTGMLPMNHGVTSNQLLQPGRKDPDWHWTRDHIKTDTFYDAALRKGMTVASLLWPVTAKSGITWNMPEIYANRPWKNQIAVSLANGTPDYLLLLQKMFGKTRQGLKQPMLDDFVHQSALWTIKEKKPDVLMIHYVDLDSMRHHYGYASKEADSALLRHDRRLTDILDILKEEGLMDDTTLFVLGDHDQLPVKNIIYLNSIFKDKGLINTTGGKITDWKAYAQTLDGSSYVHIRDKNDIDTYAKVEAILRKLESLPSYGIEKVYTSNEAADLGASRDAAFMLEAASGFKFLPDIDKPAVAPVPPAVDGWFEESVSTHGFSPDKENYTTVFFAMGQGIKKNIVIPLMSLIDEGPTFAKVMGTMLYDTDGRALDEILD